MMAAGYDICSDPLLGVLPGVAVDGITSVKSIAELFVSWL